MMSLTRASDLLNTTQCELIIDRCDLAIKRKKEKGGEGHLCHYWRESSEPTATCEQARKSSCSSSYRSACSCLSERADWLARVPRGALMCVSVRVCVGGDVRQGEEKQQIKKKEKRA